MIVCFLKYETRFVSLGKCRYFMHWKMPVADGMLVSPGQGQRSLNFP